MAELDQTCDCCGYEWPVGGVREYCGPDKEPFALCELCANTLIANAAFYPQQTEDYRVLKALGWGLNRIRQDIAEAADTQAERP